MVFEQITSGRRRLGKYERCHMIMVDVNRGAVCDVIFVALKRDPSGIVVQRQRMRENECCHYRHD